MATVGAETGKYYLYRLGIDRRKDQVQLALAMGSPQRGMSPLEMAAAYATFPSNGVFRKPYSYTRVEDRKGRVILEKDPQPTQVFKPSTAYMMTSILEEAVRGVNALGLRLVCRLRPRGRTPPARLFDRRQDGNDSRQDGQVALRLHPVLYRGGMLGFDNRIKRTLGSRGERRSDQARLVSGYESVHAELEPKEFVRPPNIVEVKVCAESGQLPDRIVRSSGSIPSISPRIRPCCRRRSVMCITSWRRRPLCRRK